MINLLKKDIRACFKTDFKMIIKLLVGIVVFSTILMPFATVAIPLFLSYIFIIKSFQIDELNKCDYFFNSMPIDKEDIVYSKYILSTIIILISLIFSYILLCNKKYMVCRSTNYRIYINYFKFIITISIYNITYNL